MKTSLKRRIPGLRTSQCPVCGELFAAPSTGDAHRRGPYLPAGARKCLTRDEMAAKDWWTDDRDVWHLPKRADSDPRYSRQTPASPLLAQVPAPGPETALEGEQ